MPDRTRAQITAEGFREIDSRLERMETMLADIRRIIVDLADGHSEHRHATRDAVDRLGTRVRALELVVPQRGVANGNGGE